MRIALDWLSAAVIVVAVSSAHYLDQSTDFNINDTALAQAYRGWTSNDKVSYRLCAEIGGPNVGFYYKDNGQLVCTNKRGYKLSTQP
jgi:hypothetical protein